MQTSYSLSLSRHFVRLMLIAAVSVVVVSCNSSRKIVVTGANATPVAKTPPEKNRAEAGREKTSRPVESLITEANSWQGTPYLWGGNDREGVDCSGFVTQVFKNALGIKLPRTSKTQSEWCTPLKRADLQPGDLVFFATDKSREGVVSHVGLYIGSGNMIHSSSSRGVIVSSLDNSYYQRTFHSGGRVEPLQAIINTSTPADITPPPSPADIIVVGTVAATSPEVATINPAKVKATPEKKPKVKKHKEKKIKEEKTGVKTKITPKQAKQATVASTSSVSAGDARSMFLNSIIEEKVDSIFSY